MKSSGDKAELHSWVRIREEEKSKKEEEQNKSVNKEIMKK